MVFSPCQLSCDFGSQEKDQLNVASWASVMPKLSRSKSEIAAGHQRSGIAKDETDVGTLRVMER